MADCHVTTTLPAPHHPGAELAALLAELQAIEADTDPASAEAAEERCNELARAIAETPATTPADVLAKLGLVEMGFRGAHGPHDQTALDSARAAVARMVLPGATATAGTGTHLLDLERQVLDLLAIDGPTESEYDRLFALVEEIYSTEPVTPADAAVKLRRMLCPVLGMPTGQRDDDLLSLGQVLEMVERQARPAADDAELFAIRAEIDALAERFGDIRADDPAFTPTRERLRHLEHNVFPLMPARTMAGITMKARELVDALDGSEETWSADVARGMLVDLERMTGATPMPADDTELATLAEAITAREKAAGVREVSEEETRRLVEEITGLYGTLASAPAVGLAGVESKLASVLNFMEASEHAEGGGDDAHDVEAVRTSLETVRRLLGKAA